MESRYSERARVIRQILHRRAGWRCGQPRALPMKGKGDEGNTE